MVIAYLSLGSNKGDRVGYVQQATHLLSALENINVIRTSTIYETEPYQSKLTCWYVNAVIEIKTSLTPQELLLACQKTEAQLGRNREAEGIHGDRTLDVDILFYGKEIINEENLQIPHSLMHKRAFTLVPMIELNADFMHPVLNKSIIDLHEELEDPEAVLLYGTKFNEI